MSIHHVSRSPSPTHSPQALFELSQVPSAQRASQAYPVASYEKAMGKLQNELSDCVNPFLVQKIRDRFLELERGVLEFPQGMFLSFRDVPLPKKMREQLEKIDQKIMGSPAPQVAMRIVISTLSQSLEKKIKEMDENPIEMWEELRLFLDLSAVQTIKNRNMQHILHLIQEKNIEDLRENVESFLSKKQLREIEGQLQETKYKNLKTLLGQLIKQKPEKRDGILTYIGQPTEFFMGKRFYLHDPVTSFFLDETIVTCSKSASAIDFRLGNGSCVSISLETGLVEVKTKEKYPLWRALCNQTVMTGEAGKIDFRSISVKNPIQPELYRISSITFEDRKWRSNLAKITLQGEESTYQLKIFYEKDGEFNFQVENVEIKMLANFFKKALSKETIPGYIFEKDCFFIKHATVHMRGIDLQNMDEQIWVKEQQRDETAMRQRHLKEIEKIYEGVLTQLTSAESSNCLHSLIDHLIATQLSPFNLTALKREYPTLIEQIEALAEKYQRDLSQKHAPQQILERLVLEANYRQVILKDRVVEVSRIMGLIENAYRHLSHIENRDIILFVGSTGSGKSTAVNYLLGAEMESFYNHVGDRVVRVKENSGFSCAKIGQSLGESETIYATAYPMDSFLALVDCPGFNDTRGMDYEICTNLSIDQAISKSNRIRSIVVTVPVQAFLMERANAVIDLIETIRERFPFAFDIESMRNTPIYLLLTKGIQLNQSPALTKLRRGERINALFAEAQESVKREQENLGREGRLQEGLNLSGFQRRERIWRTLKQMQERRHIDFIDIDDDIEKGVLLQKYSSLQSHIDKSQYVRAMEGRDMQRKFGKQIEMAAHTWTRWIFSPYLEEFPSKEAEKKREIAQKEEEYGELTAQLEKIRGEIATLEQEQKEIENFISIQGDISEVLLKRIEDLIGLESSRRRDEIEDKKMRIEGVRKRVGEIENEIKNSEYTMRAMEAKKRELDRIASDLAFGSKKVSLWCEDYRGRENQEMTLISVNSSVRRQRFRDGIKIQEEDISKRYQQNIGSYRGELFHQAYIEKNYRIVPIDSNLREQFRQWEGAQRSLKSGKYEAILEGEHFRIDLGVIPDPLGKSVRYDFVTTWQGPMPHIEIYHVIPNADYNESEIINKGSESHALQIEIANQRAKIGRKNSEKEEQANALTKLGRDKAELIEKKMASEKVAIDQILDNAIQSIGRKRAAAKEIEQTSRRVMDERERARGELDVLIAQRRRLALAMHMQWEQGKILRNFAELAVSREGEGAMMGESRSSLVEECRKFLEIYDANVTELEAQYRADLGLIS